MRAIMAGIGALAGLCLYALSEAWAGDLLAVRLMLFLSVAGMAFFAGLLVMGGPVGPRRAALAALATALPVAGLMTWASLRYDDPGEIPVSPFDAFAAIFLTMLPWPFWIAHFRGNWADYPTHFRESWSAVIRIAAALVFTLVVWGIIYLSDALLSLVGLDIIDRLIRIDVLPYVLTGAMTGLAMAVVAELADVLAPDLLIRLLRLLVPVVLVVMAVFLVALPLQGFGSVLGRLSVAGTLLAMVGVAVLLVSAACDCDEDQVIHPVMARAAQALAALVIVPAGLAVWALMLRVTEAGWTPPRVAGAAVAAVAVGYGVGYLWSLIAGRWRAGVRRVNRAMALAIMALSALWLTPVLDATAISAHSQVARYADGRGTLDRLDLYALDRWGRAGAAGMATLTALAATPGQEALAARLADRDTWTSSDQPTGAMREALLRVMPVMPSAAAASAAGVVASLQAWDLRDWQSACERRLPDGRAACVLVMADFWPDWPAAQPDAPEALFLSVASEGWLNQTALTQTTDGTGWDRRGAVLDNGAMSDDGAAAVAAVLDAGPLLEPVPQRRLRLGDRTITIAP